MIKFRNSRSFMRMIAVCVCVLVTGCAVRREPTIGDPPPPYAWVDAGSALSELRARVRLLRSMQAACEIVMTREADTVILDGAMAARFPGSMRVRAWKMGSAVFDATVSNKAVYVYDASGDEDGGAGVALARGIEGFSELLAPDFLEQAVPIDEVPRGDSDRFRLRGFLRDGREVLCDVDRRTLTLTRFGIGPEIQVLLRDHRVIGGHVWPMTWIFEGAEGVIEIRFREIAINIEIPETALTPPARARVVR